MVNYSSRWMSRNPTRWKSVDAYGVVQQWMAGDQMSIVIAIIRLGPRIVNTTQSL